MRTSEPRRGRGEGDTEAVGVREFAINAGGARLAAALGFGRTIDEWSSSDSDSSEDSSEDVESAWKLTGAFAPIILTVGCSCLNLDSGLGG